MVRLIETIETDRLIGKKISKDDLDDLGNIYYDIQIAKMTGDKKDYKETIEYTNKNIAHWNEHGFGTWVFRNKETLKFIGKAGFEIPDNKDKIDSQLYFVVAVKFWKQGFGTEMVKACMDVAINNLKLERVSSIAYLNNIAAHKVMEKAGLKYEKDISENRKDMSEQKYVLYRYNLITADVEVA